MILVTVGTHDQQFDRLVKGADQLASQLPERVIIQRGCSNYVPCFAQHFQWTSGRQMEALTLESRLVISQASAGAVILAIRMNKPIVMVPRLKRFRENHNDHQLQLALALAEIDRVVVVEEPAARTLGSAIDQCIEKNYPYPGEDCLQKSLKQLLENWSTSGSALNPEVER